LVDKGQKKNRTGYVVNLFIDVSEITSRN